MSLTLYGRYVNPAVEAIIGFMDPDLAEFTLCIVCGTEILDKLATLDGIREGITLTGSLQVVAWCTNPECEKDRATVSYTDLNGTHHQGEPPYKRIFQGLRPRMRDLLHGNADLESLDGHRFYDEAKIADTLNTALEQLKQEIIS